MAKRGRPFKRSQAEIHAISEITKQYRKLKRRISNISKKYGEDTIPSVEHFYKKGLDRFSVKNKNLQELNKLRADIEYVSGLKTSYVKGAEKYTKYVAEWKNLFYSDRGLYNKIMTLYNRLVEENELAEKFKYKIIEEIYTMYETRGEMSPDEQYLHIREFFEELYLNSSIEDLIKGDGYEIGGKVRKS